MVQAVRDYAGKGCSPCEMPVRPPLAPGDALGPVLIRAVHADEDVQVAVAVPVSDVEDVGVDSRTLGIAAVGVDRRSLDARRQGISWPDALDPIANGTAAEIPRPRDQVQVSVLVPVDDGNACFVVPNPLADASHALEGIVDSPFADQVALILPLEIKNRSVVLPLLLLLQDQVHISIMIPVGHDDIVKIVSAVSDRGKRVVRTSALDQPIWLDSFEIM
mmetsp:Transcript_41006/g.123810  ORF Transcript_41006/g.123810 Transcript_41006/m.123810 type:complete len:219 (-) Transcript_41006:711-1367(-)